MNARLALILIVAVVVVGLTLGAIVVIFSNSHKPVNPLCTPAAVASLNAYWQNQIADANFDNINQVISQATAATEQRIKLCGNGG